MTGICFFTAHVVRLGPHVKCVEVVRASLMMRMNLKDLLRSADGGGSPDSLACLQLGRNFG